MTLSRWKTSPSGQFYQEQRRKIHRLEVILRVAGVRLSQAKAAKMTGNEQVMCSMARKAARDAEAAVQRAYILVREAGEASEDFEARAKNVLAAAKTCGEEVDKVCSPRMRTLLI